MSIPPPRRKKKASRKSTQTPKSLPHCPNSDGAELRRRELHRVFSEEFDHPNKENEHRPGWSAKRLAELVGYGVLTVKRTIAYMRKTLMLPIGYNKKRDTYYYKERVAAFPTTQVSEGDLICLCGMMQAIAPFRNTPFVKKLRPLIDNFIQSMPPELRVSFRTLEQRISFRAIGMDANLDPTTFETVIAALLKNQELAIDYAKMHYDDDDEGNTAADDARVERAARPSSEAARLRHPLAPTGPNAGDQHTPPTTTTPPSAATPPPPQPERRTIEPLHLACVDNAWYLFANDPSREKIRRFLLTRIQRVRETGQTFKPRAFDIDAVLGPVLGIFDGGGEPVNLRIRFRGKGVRLIQERSWHRSQTLEMRPDGTLVLGLRVTHTPQLEGWILHWGRLAQVLEPAAVHEGVESQAREILQPWPA